MISSYLQQSCRLPLLKPLCRAGLSRQACGRVCSQVKCVQHSAFREALRLLCVCGRRAQLSPTQWHCFRARGTCRAARTWAYGYQKGRCKEHAIISQQCLGWRLAQAGRSHATVLYDMQNVFGPLTSRDRTTGVLRYCAHQIIHASSIGCGATECWCAKEGLCSFSRLARAAHQEGGETALPPFSSLKITTEWLMG
eukprot:5258928-Amphidinium_carterae.1